MFDLTTGHIDRPFRTSKPGWTLLSLGVHVALLGVIVVIPLLYFTNQLPTVNEIEAFVVPAERVAPPPPPPPPAAPAAAKPKAAQATPQPTPVEPQIPTAPVAPVTAPEALPEFPPAVAGGVPGGELGGIEGGEVGGVSGGQIGGVIGAPPPPGPVAPVRVGGQITTPALVKRIRPQYPQIAIAAKMTGTVVLELTVDQTGRVQHVDVLRSQGLLDQAAVDAVRQWRYSPLVLNGQPTPFVVTVTMNFSLRNGQTPQVAGD